MNNTTKEFILNLTESDIAKAEAILYALESIAWSKFDWDKATSYCNKVQTIEADIRHIKELI